MTESKKKSKNVVKSIPVEEADLNDTDDINQFIRKIQLQGQVLKKLTENLEHSTDKGTHNHLKKIDLKKK